MRHRAAGDDTLRVVFVNTGDGQERGQGQVGCIMSDVIISYTDADEALARELAARVEESGYTTWYYERDIQAGASVAQQTSSAIGNCQALIAIISPDALDAAGVLSDVRQATRRGKSIVPLLKDLTRAAFDGDGGELRSAIGDAATIRIPPEGVAAIVPRVLAGFHILGVSRGGHASAAPTIERLAVTPAEPAARYPFAGNGAAIDAQPPPPTIVPPANGFAAPAREEQPEAPPVRDPFTPRADTGGQAARGVTQAFEAPRRPAEAAPVPGRAPAVGPRVRVTSPRGRETWQAGTMHTIMWSALAAPGATIRRVEIELLRAGERVLTIVGAGSYLPRTTTHHDWMVPPHLPQGINYAIRVVAWDNQDRRGHGITAGPFTIAEADQDDSYPPASPPSSAMTDRHHPSGRVFGVPHRRGGRGAAAAPRAKRRFRLMSGSPTVIASAADTTAEETAAKAVDRAAPPPSPLMTMASITGTDVAASDTVVDPMAPAVADAIEYGEAADVVSASTATAPPPAADTTPEDLERADDGAPVSTSTPAPARVTVLAPEPGDVWEAGESHTIRWTAEPSGGATLRGIEVQLWRGDSLLRTITERRVDGTATELSYEWTVPASVKPGDNYWIKVVARDTLGHEGAGFSRKSFAIGDPHDSARGVRLTVTSPQRGDEWPIGSSVLLSWEMDAPRRAAVERIEIELHQGAERVMVIAGGDTALPPSARNFTWDIPRHVRPGGYRIRIAACSKRGVVASADSSGSLTITAPRNPVLTTLQCVGAGVAVGLMAYLTALLLSEGERDPAVAPERVVGGLALGALAGLWIVHLSMAQRWPRIVGGATAGFVVVANWAYVVNENVPAAILAGIAGGLAGMFIQWGRLGEFG